MMTMTMTTTTTTTMTMTMIIYDDDVIQVIINHNILLWGFSWTCLCLVQTTLTNFIMTVTMITMIMKMIIITTIFMAIMMMLNMMIVMVMMTIMTSTDVEYDDYDGYDRSSSWLRRSEFLRATVKATVVTCRVRNPACTTTKHLWETVLHKWFKRPWCLRLWHYTNSLIIIL